MGVRLLQGDAFANPRARLAAAGLLATAVLVVMVNSGLSRFTHVVFFWLFIGYAQARELRFVVYGLALAVWSLLAGPFRAMAALAPEARQWAVGRWSRVTLLPLVACLPFLFLYSVANPAFEKIVSSAFSWLFRPLDQLGNPLLWFTAGWGLVLALAVLFPLVKRPRWLEQELHFSDDLQRRREESIITRLIWDLPLGMLRLRREHRAAALCLWLLNALLLVANLTDLRYVWLDAGAVRAADLSRYVHEGTYALIFSILLAMLVVLYVFRGNLNFYRDNGLLRGLTYAWLAQNALLALSVAVRNGHYIRQYGLAEGRIVVAFFLLCVGWGLWTMAQKVRWRKSLFYLIQRNAAGFLAVLFLFATVNWTVMITRFNLHFYRPDQVDYQYLISGLSDRNLFLLKELALPEPEAGQLQEKREGFQHRYAAQDWREWNWPDYRNATIRLSTHGQH